MKNRPKTLIFLLAAAVFGVIHAVPGFGDPDALYHLEMAKLTAAGPVRAFPWLPFTTLAERYADHHFLYHVALVPFVNLFGDFLGLKLATILFAALAAAAFCGLLQAYGVRRPALWTLPLLFTPGLDFRLLLSKTTSLSLAALFLFLILLRRGKRWPLFFLSFAFVWLYGGWPILLVVAGIDALVRKSWRLLPSVAAGLAAGVVINPFFPNDLFFYWEQIVRVAVVGRNDPSILVGNEWYPAELGWLLIEDAPIFLALAASVVGLAWMVMKGRPPREDEVPPERRRAIVLAFALAAVFSVMTLRQARQKEYFLPLALFAAALLGDALGKVDGASLLAAAKTRLGRAARPLAVVFALAVAVGATGFTRHLYALRNPWTRFASAAAWTRGHAAAGETVFHTSWDDFPYLFYRDPDRRYVAGLDPRFLSDADPAKYQEWRDISEGRVREDLAERIEKDFGARYVFLRMAQEPLRPLLKKDPSFERVYADAEAEVWRIRARSGSSARTW